MIDKKIINLIYLHHLMEEFARVQKMNKDTHLTLPCCTKQLTEEAERWYKEQGG